MNIKNHILSFGFLLGITFPLINNFIPIISDSVNTENREMKNLPKLSDGAEKLAKGIEDYLIDHTSVRNKMISFYNQLNIMVFRSSPVSIKAFIGKEGWYYFSGEELKTFNGTELFTEEQLSDFKNEMISREKIIEALGAKFYIAIVPNKSNIYPEFMPDHIIRSNTVGYGQQMLNYLKQNKVPVIDLYTPLLEAKQSNQVYFKTDNHWNDLGAFAASNVVINEMKSSFPKMSPLNLSEYPIVRIKEKAGAIAKMLSLQDELVEYNYIPKPKNGFTSELRNLNKYKSPEGFAYPWDYEYTRYTKKDSLPSVLIIRDSFGEKFFPYFSEQTKKCTMIFDAWHYGLNEDIIKGEKPDVVLLLIIESNLKDVMKHSGNK